MYEVREVGTRSTTRDNYGPDGYRIVSRHDTRDAAEHAAAAAAIDFRRLYPDGYGVDFRVAATGDEPEPVTLTAAELAAETGIPLAEWALGPDTPVTVHSDGYVAAIIDGYAVDNITAGDRDATEAARRIYAHRSTS